MSINRRRHSPTPYWIDGDGLVASGSGESYITAADVYCRPTSEAAEEMEANAEFIVRACNAHDQFVTAAKNALSFLEQLGYRDGELAESIARAETEGGAA